MSNKLTVIKTPTRTEIIEVEKDKDNLVSRSVFKWLTGRHYFNMKVWDHATLIRVDVEPPELEAFVEKVAALLTERPGRRRS